MHISLQLGLWTLKHTHQRKGEKKMQRAFDLHLRESRIPNENNILGFETKRALKFLHIEPQHNKTYIGIYEHINNFITLFIINIVLDITRLEVGSQNV